MYSQLQMRCVFSGIAAVLEYVLYTVKKTKKAFLLNEIIKNELKMID